MVQFLLTRPEPLIIYYHNITPARFFTRWEPVAAASMGSARAELRQLVPTTRLAMAPSHYSESELIDVGYRDTTVSPLLVDFDDYDKHANSKVLARLRRKQNLGGARWLFVGRVAPNKCQHDVIGAFAAYRHMFDPSARLALVGGVTSDLYYRSLRRLVAELGVETSVEILGPVSFDELLAHYRSSAVFVCLSEHEGFCVPILEAMHFGVPVIAYAAAAVPETVGNAGLMLPDKDPLVVASAVDRVLSDQSVRAELVRAGRARVKEFALPNTSQALLKTLSCFIAQHGVEHG
jgi:glycosyltransferase involved in cell wall biosynthesis